MKSWRPGLLLICLVILQGCCMPRAERMILLPGAGENRTGALLVQRGANELLLDQPYAEARVHSQGPLKRSVSNEADVRREFGPLLAVQPPRARSFLVTFLSNSNTLTPETQPVLEQVREALAADAVGDLIVIGHTDGVGSHETNDQLSLDRAWAVQALLVAMGVPAEVISVQARGMREPLVLAPAQTAEPRNRRVEIKLR